jgi:hypothetical protein
MLTEETHFLFNMKKIAYFTEILHGPNSEHEHIQVNLELFIIGSLRIRDLTFSWYYFYCISNCV